jgi:transposase
VNALPGLAKSMGDRVPSCDPDTLDQARLEELSEPLREVLKPLVKQVESLTEQIQQCDQKLEQIARTQYPETELLRQVYGVGILIALTFVLTVEDSERFTKSRMWAATWDCGPNAASRGSAIPSCGSPRKGMCTCGRCWCKGRIES